MASSGRVRTVLVALALLAGACGSDGDDRTATATSTTAGPAPGGGSAATVTVWHALDGAAADVFDELVAAFNARGDGRVEPAFKGSEDDIFNELATALDTGGAPNLAQVRDLAAQAMLDTDRVVPASEFLPADVLADLVDGPEPLAVGLAATTPIVYLNADRFAAAGLDLPAPDWTTDAFLSACEALEADGVDYCVTFGQIGWNFEQLLANSGGLYLAPDNGATGRATDVVFDEGPGPDAFSFLSGLLADGRAPDVGGSWTETDRVFLAGDAAMLFDATVGARTFHDEAEFEVVAANLPHTTGTDRHGVAVGGGALWLIESGDDEADRVAADFLAFLLEPEQQAAWHVGTGFLPLRRSVIDDPPAAVRAFWSAYPAYEAAVDQVASTRRDRATGTPAAHVTATPRAGPLAELRQLFVDAYGAVLDRGEDPIDALRAAADAGDAALADHERRRGG